MDRIINWVKAHRWETVSATLGALLVASLAVLAVAMNDSEEPEAVATTTTTTAPTTTLPTATTVTQAGDTEPVPTTEPSLDVSGATAVVVDNVPDVGFQIGIDSADLLIETPVEGGLSRFTAFYGDQLPELVGPVRSVRPVSADLLAPFRPLLFTSGGQPFVVGAVTAAGVTIVTPEESIAFQSLERPQPYHVFVSPGVEVTDGAALIIPWAEGEWAGGDAASEVTVPVSDDVTWRYEDGAYVRYQGDAPHEVQPDFEADPVPLTRDTLILLVAHQKSAGYTDSAGADVPTYDVVGGGDLYVLHNGEVVEGTWFRANQAEDYTFTDENGNDLPIPAGATYLAVVPEGAEVTISG